MYISYKVATSLLRLIFLWIDTSLFMLLQQCIDTRYDKTYLSKWHHLCFRARIYKIACNTFDIIASSQQTTKNNVKYHPHFNVTIFITFRNTCISIKLQRASYFSSFFGLTYISFYALAILYRYNMM